MANRGLWLATLCVGMACNAKVDTKNTRAHEGPIADASGGNRGVQGGHTDAAAGGARQHVDANAEDASASDVSRPATPTLSDATSPNDAGPNLTPLVDASNALKDATPTRYASHCHALSEDACALDPECDWSMDAQVPSGCYARCPTPRSLCGPRADCEQLVSASDSCGVALCVPHDVLPEFCGTTFPCTGAPADICWRQRPEPCGPCDNCIDEVDPPTCLTSPDGVRHWFGSYPEMVVLLEPGWSTCGVHPMDCD